MRLEEDVLIVALSDAGTIRGASRNLYISQPAISQRLKQIEERWGEPLFIRTHKSLIPTPAGEEIIAYSKKRLYDEKQLQDRLSAVTGTVRGTLSLAVSSVIAQYYLPPLLREYTRLYPDVKMDLRTGLSSTMYDERHQVHLAILRGDVEDTDALKELFSEKLFYVSRKDSLSPSLFIEFQSDFTFHSIVNDWFLTTELTIPKQTIKVDQIETCKQLMLHGIGSCVLPELATNDLTTQHCHLQSLQIRGQDLLRKTWLHCSPKHADLPQVRAFLDLLKSTP
ncbi:LysR family transcriptional regulator [Shouchella patagoniensis]|uniref:LysR family transcriptional regulator n=1 Tax=Shouchella patagoniensis TaxID=228576 RepID=UPI0014768027|nr:LysR family transcriptional regulator [Shouchella patagoniensis]